jgi:hypothetical protein
MYSACYKIGLFMLYRTAYTLGITGQLLVILQIKMHHKPMLWYYQVFCNLWLFLLLSVIYLLFKNFIN